MSDWQPIETAPKDGTNFLAWCSVTADEIDEYDRIIRKNITEFHHAVAYWVFGGFVERPWRGSCPVNLRFLAWMPLPSGPPEPTS